MIFNVYPLQAPGKKVVRFWNLKSCLIDKYTIVMIVVLYVDSTKNIWSLLLQNNGYKIIFGDYMAVLFIGIRGMFKF